MQTRSILACSLIVSGAIAATSVTWLGACTFYLQPKIIDIQKQSGKPTEALIDAGICRDAADRSLAVLSSLLATLLSLIANPPRD